LKIYKKKIADVFEDHELVILDLDYVRTVEEPIVKYFRDFRRINLPALEAELSQVDWTAMVSALDINSNVESFNSIMTALSWTAMRL
jgi:hypothetical protein